MASIPTLLRRHLWQVGGGLLGTPLVVELDSDPVDADVPVEEVRGVLEMTQYGHGHVEAR